MRRILVAYVDEDELQLFRDSHRREVGLAVRVATGDVRSVRAAIIVNRGQVRFIARAEPLHTSGELRYLFNFSEAVQAAGPALTPDQLEVGLTANQVRPLRRPGGVLGEAATRTIAKRIVEHAEAHQKLGIWLAESANRVELPADSVLPEMREGTMLAFKLAGMDVDQVAEEEEWGASELDEVFLPPTPREDPIIEHDMRAFLGMRRRDVRIASAVFEDDRKRTLRVYNVNRTKAETALGGDLIYFHEQRRSLVVVQYKRMATGPGGKWLYRPDSQFAKQAIAFSALERRLGRIPADSPHAYRLGRACCFFKFCRMGSYDIAERALSPGSYIANDHLQLHLQSDESLGPEGGRVVVQESCDGGLTNTLFSDCTAYGLIGSRPIAPGKLRSLVHGLRDTSRATVIGVLDDPEGLRPGPASRARRVGRASQKTLI